MEIQKLTQKDFMVMEYLHELSRIDRTKLLFIFNDMKKNIMQDDAIEQVDSLIERIKR